MEEKKLQHSDFVVEMAIEFWRLKKRLGNIKSSLAVSESQALSDQIQRMQRVFEKYQIEIRDPKGEIYTDGCSLKPIYIQDVEDLPAGVCRVIETVKPSILSCGVVIFQGEVIVGQGKMHKSDKVGA